VTTGSGTTRVTSRKNGIPVSIRAVANLKLCVYYLKHMEMVQRQPIANAINLVLVRSYRDQPCHEVGYSVLNAILTLVAKNEYEKCNWELNHYLGHNTLYPHVWRHSIQNFYTNIALGEPASDYIISYLYSDRVQIRTAYGNMKQVVTHYVNNQFS
jgi:hypothetical protein